ncbi:aldose 1-epimerase-like isoform X3 [Takifugu rubripes]|uniref:aldose 1-epimerase-like isoform X3 n=1 Tax=Takifugu rubripes TaxID=31033 RepID=UPI0011458B0C|nr:aldose 1-epimerase-like isoform X3 [Takifugu rubripes]
MTQVSQAPWGEVPGQGVVHLWLLQSPQLQVEILTLGATIKSVFSRGRDGRSADVVLGYDHLQAGYLSDRRYLGATVGRVANRIAKGLFVVDGVQYKLDTNNGPNAIHGGLQGFSKALWRAEAVDAGVQLSLTSPDGDQGYPGELHVSLTYTLKGAPDIYDHQVSISAQWYLPVDDTSIPTGDIRPVEGTLFDLRKPVLLGPRLKELPGPGFDHNFCLCASKDVWKERRAARVVHPASGRVLEVWTSQPGLQFYTANYLDGSVVGKGGVPYGKHSSFCLETQNWPDAVNQPTFPNCLLQAGEQYHHVTRLSFTTAP